MIKSQVSGDVFQSPQKHIVFAVNMEGNNDAGFAGQVSRHIRPELVYTGGNKLGDIISFTSQGKTFHAIVCHSLHSEIGWKQAPEIIEQCLNRLEEVPDDEPIAVVLMGGGFVGQMMGADIRANLAAMQRSKKTVVVYSL